MKTFLLTIIPAAMAAFGTLSLVHWAWTRFTFCRTIGTVESFEASDDAEGGKVYSVVFVFDYEGRAYRKTDAMGMGWKLFNVGQKVAISFPSGEPEKAGIDWVWVPIVYALVAFAGLAFAIFILLR